jgi:Lrp/AsnC family leucine-responsive transcriptional regulator
MDEKDLRLFQLLLINNRITHREMAHELGISVPSVHRRLQNLIDQGIVTKFTANISSGYLRAVPVKIMGVSESLSINGHMKEPTERSFTEKVYQFGSNALVITLLLKGLDDLGPSVERIRENLEIRELSVVIPSRATSANIPVHHKYTGTKPLTLLDYRIIAALHDDARKPLNEVADDLDVSVKTVRRHFDTMVEQGSIELSTNWMPERTSGIYSLVHIELRPGENKGRYIARINDRFGPRILVGLESSNLPDLVVLSCWSPTMDKHMEMVEDITNDEETVLTFSRIIRSTWLFKTWRNKLLQERIAGPWH